MAGKNDYLRNYKLSDAEMIQTSRVFHQLFINDQALFEAFDADFAEPFAADWLAKIEEADAFD